MLERAHTGDDAGVEVVGGGRNSAHDCLQRGLPGQVRRFMPLEAVRSDELKYSHRCLSSAVP